MSILGLVLALSLTATDPKSDVKGKEKYPVVQIAYPDAQAYAK